MGHYENRKITTTANTRQKILSSIKKSSYTSMKLKFPDYYFFYLKRSYGTLKKGYSTLIFIGSFQCNYFTIDGNQVVFNKLVYCVQFSGALWDQIKSYFK